jgi:hypothetical protein
VQRQDVHSKAAFERPAPISVTCRRNGKRLYCAQSATTFTNLILPKRGFVNTRTTVAASMVNVKIVSLLLVQHPLPREAARRHGWRLRLIHMTNPNSPPPRASRQHSSCAHQCPLLGVKRTWRFQNVISAFDPKRTLSKKDSVLGEERNCSILTLVGCYELQEPEAIVRAGVPV